MATVAKELPACPVETTLTLISDKWKVLVLRDLMPGTKRFGELKIYRQCKPEGIDSAASSNGGKWTADSHCVSRGSAACGIHINGIGI